MVSFYNKPSEQKMSAQDKIDTTNEDEIPDSIIARNYPKTIYLWPTMILGFVIVILDYLLTNILDSPPVDQELFNAMLAAVWLIVVAFNLIVISFDFSFGRTFTIFITIAFLVLLYIVVRDFFNFDLPIDFPSLAEVLKSININSSPTFFLLYSLILLLIYIVLFIKTQFVYWEFTSNRIIHHRGIFEREESFSAQNSRVITETTDVFERLLFRAGTIYVIDDQGKVHKIENVYNAANKDDEIQDILSVVNVRT